jgi:hypothetical protein
MPSENPWLNLSTWISVGGLVIGASGFLFGIVSFIWNRRESRLDALSKVLQPMVRAAQHLYKANQARRSCEQLRISFPNPATAQEAQRRLDEFFKAYTESIKESETEFRLAESEFAARYFRFPDAISRLTQQALGTLSEFARLVNEGLFDKAELALAKFRDDHRQIAKVGRGWRLADPFEGLKAHFKKEDRKQEQSPYALSREEFKSIMDLVEKRATSQARNTFAVHPPKKLLERPEIANSDRVIEELEDSVFVVVFQDGMTKLLSLVELMVFTYNLIILKMQTYEVNEMLRTAPPAETRIQVKFALNIEEIMRPEMVKALLGKIEFSPVASDEMDSGMETEQENVQSSR